MRLFIVAAFVAGLVGPASADGYALCRKYTTSQAIDDMCRVVFEADKLRTGVEFPDTLWAGLSKIACRDVDKPTRDEFYGSIWQLMVKNGVDRVSYEPVCPEYVAIYSKQL